LPSKLVKRCHNQAPYLKLALPVRSHPWVAPDRQG